jgi:biotin carboxyl carrier protein
VTEGKIAVDEDRSTPIFSPYAGRVTKLFVKPGDVVTAGQQCSRLKPSSWCWRKAKTDI